MKLRPLTVIIVAVLLVAAGGAAAVYLTQKRDVTTSSEEARSAYREAIENERRYYFREARVGYARALELDNEFAMAMLGLARQANDREQALALIGRAEKLKPRLTDRERRQIDLALAARSGKLDEAEKIARAILDKYPDDVRATSYCAAREMDRGNQDAAVALFKRVLEVNPNSAEAYNLLGYYHAYRGEVEKGIEYLKKYQFMSPDQANPHDSLGEVLAYSGRYDEAIQNLERALQVKPDFFASYAHLAVAYTGKGDYARAREMWLKQATVVDTDPERYTALMLALVSAVSEGNREAIAQLTPQVQKLTEQKDLANGKHTLAALLALARGRGAEAEAELTVLEPKLHAKYGDLFQRAGQKPYFDSWTYMMAWAKRLQGKTDEAMSLYRTMIDPPNPWASFPERQWIYEARAQLAEMLAVAGQLDEAEKLLQENHKWNPSWAPAREAELTVARLRREKVLAAAK